MANVQPLKRYELPADHKAIASTSDPSRTIELNFDDSSIEGVLVCTFCAALVSQAARLNHFNFHVAQIPADAPEHVVLYGGNVSSSALKIWRAE